MESEGGRSGIRSERDLGVRRRLCPTLKRVNGVPELAPCQPGGTGATFLIRLPDICRPSPPPFSAAASSRLASEWWKLTFLE